MVLALVTVFVVILAITGNIKITLFVLICVALVDLFLFALLVVWNVELNNVTIINVVIAIGLAVDYSAHIGHTYLQINPPEQHQDGSDLTDKEKRRYKTQVAVGKMGSSVFHGAFSTFLAIIVLAPS
jgi:Niemann-Pick C1 protein